MRRRRLRGILLLVICLLFLPALATAADREPPLRIAYTDWSSSVANAHLVQALVQEKLGIPCEMLRFEAEEMWRAVAEGRADVMLSGWLPATHADYLERYGDDLVDLGPNLTGARIGLVVPDVAVGRQTGPYGRRARPYIETESIPDLEKHAEEFRRRIVGIDPGAGIMARTREALAAYGLDRYRLVDGSEVSMTAELSHAIRHQQWIVVTGWTPHWMFARWSLRFLDDPLGIYGGEEAIHTLVRSGLVGERPRVATLLGRFSWSPEEMGQYLIWNQADGGIFPYEKALRWLHTHPHRVAEWLAGEMP